MELRALGNTDIRVSVVAMGCWPIAGGFNWGPQDEQDSIATIRAAVENGVNFFDTAEAYGDGRSEELLGQVLADRRRDVVIASKFSSRNAAPEDLRAACERSLRRLRTDYIDLYQIHWPRHDLPFEPVMRTLEQLRQAGKIRAIGVSNFAVRDLTDWLRIGSCATDQLPYNLLWRAIEFHIQPLCVKHGIGILCYSSLLMGLLTGKFGSPDEVPPDRARTRHFSRKRPHVEHDGESHEELTFATIERIRRICKDTDEPMADVALAWLLHQPGVTCVLAGARRPEQIAENVRAARLRLSEESVRELSEATEPLKRALGTNPDMWRTQSRMR